MSIRSSSGRRVALFGGSFNPPHVAHQMVCLWALSTGRVDEVWLVPCFQHAFDKELASFEKRRAMCQAAAQSFPPGAVHVCTIEAELGGTSRTFVTVTALRSQHPEHRFSLLLGADLLQETSAWYRFEDLQELVPLIVVGRPGYPGPEGSVELAHISSSEVRRSLSARADVSGLVPQAVLDLIEADGLYGG